MNCAVHEYAGAADFLLTFDAPFFFLTPYTLSARVWIADYIPEDATRWGCCSIVIEHRFVSAIAAGILADGLTIEGS